VGYAKALACAEVLFGLSFVGIGIAKITSATQSYYLGQLYARDAQERFEDYVIELRKVREQYKGIARSQQQGVPVHPSLGASHLEAQKLLKRIRDYASFEIRQGDLLRKMPIGPLAHVSRTCFQILPIVEKTANFSASLHSQRQRRMAKSLILQIEELVNLISQNCEDRIVSAEASKLRKKCEDIGREIDTRSGAMPYCLRKALDTKQ
jgi:hypothetical protein